MNNIYRQYLDGLGVIKEEDFVKLLDSLPEFDYLDDDDIILSEDPLEILFDSGVLKGCDFYNTFIDEGNKIIDLDYSEYNDKSISDLESLNERLKEKGWTIGNYNELLESLEEHNTEEEELNERYELMKEISENTTTEQLRKIVNSL